MIRPLAGLHGLALCLTFFVVLGLFAQQPTPAPQPSQQEQKEKKDQPVPPVPAPDQPKEKKDEPKPDEQKKDSEKKESEKKNEAAEDKAKQPEARKWDVNDPPGPKHNVAIDTDEGTWMSVDVSPDGKQIVFDLLGDIYVMPITGGEAKALTSGMAWDMQPRFSPDGKRIAFTSDRAGGDNVWVMNSDGSDPKQVTKESFRLVNSPAWSPDGQFIVVRKHFTGTRSLGAGEMWLYHWSGSDGLQMTKRPNDQKDVGEPVFSPDGRYLYYSQDVTPGKIFEYNKDPHGEIYIIQRLDRRTGDTDRYITGQGGSVRPTPSPDGKLLAFVRRVREKSVLYVADLKSGAETPIYDGLDRDMQETWAIHGVYPQMAWMPDNKSIVFWANGHINRIDLATKKAAVIPFRVKSTRAVEEAVRFPVAVAPEKFPVRMLRWAQVSPSGDRVVYSAMGYLYVRDLPDGAPRRLTRQTEHFEFYPQVSRDGKSIVYTTWNDQKLGSILVVSADGGEGRVITTDPGHYVEPTFSPDGSKVVYRTIGGGGILSAEYSHDTGIYWIPAGGGTPMLVTKKGNEPQFGADNTRIYFADSEDQDKRTLSVIKLDGSDEHKLYSSEAATQFRISPDEKWIAWTERFNAYVAPLELTGATQDIGPDTKAVPVTRLSSDAGNFLHWSGDSKRLYWSLGPQLFSRDLKDSFTFVDGAAKELPKDAGKQGVNISFDQKFDVPTGKLALTGARVITMKGDEVIANGTVVLEGNRITAVGPRGSVKVPGDAKVIDASGKTIMPGIVDVHWHGQEGQDEFIAQQDWFNYAALGFGVTTIHDPSNSTTEIFTSAEMQKAGLITGPRIFSTGTILYGAKTSFQAVINNLDDALFHMKRMQAQGAISVKSYNQPRREQRQEVIEAARQLKMMVVPEGGSTFMHNMTMIADGHTGIEHALPVAKIYKDVDQFWSGTKVGYTPTLIVAYGGIWGENYWYQNTKVWEDKRLLTFVPRQVVDERALRPTVTSSNGEYNHMNAARGAARLASKGVGVQIGAHGQREGLGAHWETWMLVQGGMTPMQALHAATISGARYLAMDKEIGSLEPGKLADLIVLDANPLENIRNTETVRYTVVNGRIFDAATMNEIGNHPRNRQQFFFEQNGGNWVPSKAATADLD